MVLLIYLNPLFVSFTPHHESDNIIRVQGSIGGALSTIDVVATAMILRGVAVLEIIECNEMFFG